MEICDINNREFKIAALKIFRDVRKNRQAIQ